MLLPYLPMPNQQGSPLPSRARSPCQCTWQSLLLFDRALLAWLRSAGPPSDRLLAAPCRVRKSSPPRVAFAPLSPRDAEALLASLGSQDGDARDAAPSAGAAPSIRRWGSVKGLFRLGQDAARGAPRPGGPAGGRSSHKALNGAGGRAGGELSHDAKLERSEEGRVARALAASRGSARSEAARREGAAAEDAARTTAAEQARADQQSAVWVLRQHALAAVLGNLRRDMRASMATVRAEALSVPQEVLRESMH